MKEVKVELKLESDIKAENFSFIFTEDLIQIKYLGSNIIKCTWDDKFDPEWNGEDLIMILEENEISCPSGFKEMIVYAWKEWRDNKLNDSELISEMQELSKWLNVITKKKPKTKFWSIYF
ncbi:MAG: hypothetical protein PF574_02690 [Candidatus Delongbacteria bacterium]|jgi:hypothetical protein|nr:hypothetical protein [Candidatus Delongbacteria bacterium]